MMGGGNGSFAHPNHSLEMRNLHGEQNQPHEWAGFSLTLRSTEPGKNSWFLQENFYHVSFFHCVKIFLDRVGSVTMKS